MLDRQGLASHADTCVRLSTIDSIPVHVFSDFYALTWPAKSANTCERARGKSRDRTVSAPVRDTHASPSLSDKCVAFATLDSTSQHSCRFFSTLVSAHHTSTILRVLFEFRLSFISFPVSFVLVFVDPSHTPWSKKTPPAGRLSGRYLDNGDSTNHATGCVRKRIFTST